MNFRSVSDLYSTVRKQCHRFPRDIDLIVGVPRSGLLAANAVSLALNRPLTDLNSFLEGRVYGGFSRRTGAQADQDANYKSVLIVDDSILTGHAMQKVRKRIQDQSLNHAVVYAAVYGLHRSHPEVDIVLERCASPRMFEWNALHHPSLDISCVDLDGVLCVDPEDSQNDDGLNYIEFMRSATVLNVPTYKINSIVTARLEKYRPHTEAWLEANGIQYDNLYMLDLPSADERRRRRIHAEFKAEIYGRKEDCWLFIESNTAQASAIQERTGKSVLAYQDMIFFPEGGLARIQRATTRSGFRSTISQMLPIWSKALIKSIMIQRTKKIS
jgi:uncharacterized HAD superfamily protein/hypoxanthine phosphoribosyltransferase